MGFIINPYAFASSAPPIMADNPDYYRVVLNLDATGQADGTGYAAEESRHAHALTYNGNAAILSEKFEFDGTGDYIDIANSLMFTPGSMFTLEVFRLVFDIVNDGQVNGVITQYEADSGEIGWQLAEDGGNLKFTWSTNGTATTHSITIGSVSTVNEYNVVVCWDGTTVFSLLNGSQGGSTAFTGNFAHPGVRVRLGALADNDLPTGYLDGRFKGIIFTKGEALYAPSGSHGNTPFPRTIDTPSLTDALWPNVVWLIAYDENLGRIRDFGPLDLPVTIAGNAAGNATGSVSGSSNTIDFDGSGGFLGIVDDALTRMQDGTDFCFDAVLKTTDLSHNNTITNKRGASNARDAALVITSAGNLAFTAWNSSNTAVLNISGATAITTETDHHVAATLSGTSARVFLDGTQDASGTKSGTIAGTGDTRLFGRDASNTARDFEGQWAWMRCTKGNARYTSGFTPPTGAPPVG